MDKRALKKTRKRNVNHARSVIQEKNVFESSDQNPQKEEITPQSKSPFSFLEPIKSGAGILSICHRKAID